jgi:uncharacterized lipoprotein YmbA
MTRLALALALCSLAAACGETAYYAPPPSTSALRVNAATTSVELRGVSIPEYAVNQEIPLQQPDGSLVTDTSRLWADLPDRALAASLVRHLNQITDAVVAVEPWPLEGIPQTELRIFVEDMIVQANATLLFTGTYAIRSDGRRGRVEPFTIVAPVADTENYAAIVAAHEAAWLLLAEQIARRI